MKYFLPDYCVTLEAVTLEEAVKRAEEEAKKEKKKSKKTTSPS